MSYNQGGQQGYGSYNPYGGSGNPYAQQDNPYAQQDNPYTQQGGYQQSGGYDQPQQGGYGGGRPPMQQQGSSNYQDVEQGQGGYEMSNMNGNDPNRILNGVREIDRAIDGLQRTLQSSLKDLHKRIVDETSPEASQVLLRQLEKENTNIMDTYRGLVARVKRIKSDPESGNPRNSAQVGKVDRRLKSVIHEYQGQDQKFRNAMDDRVARDYRTVRPDASDAEVREALQDSNQQIFSQALLNSDRTGNATSTQKNVKARHEAIQKIEKDMIELAQLFQDLEAQVIQQEPAVTQIEQRGEEVNDHVAKANTELDGAVTKARSARRKKWWCFLIVVLIIIVIAVGVGVGVAVSNNK